MSRKRILALLIPVVSFLLGVFAQVMFDQWISSRNALLISIAVVIIGLVAIFSVLEYLEKRFDSFDSQLLHIANRMGLYVEYIEDNQTGKSYRRSTELVEQAQFSLIFVAQWEPFPDYLVNGVNVNRDSDSAPILEARRQFYEVLTQKVEAHQNDEKPFYIRIIQLPGEYMNKYIPFEIDQILYKHLLSISQLKSRSCILRKTAKRINLTFTIIDDRFIIMPILTSIKNAHQARHGTLLFDDPQGDLIRRLKSMYWSIEAQALPLDINQNESVGEAHVPNS
jgi:hypothetical protein